MDDMQRYLKEREKSSEPTDILEREKIRRKRYREICSVVFNTIVGIWVLLAIWHFDYIVHFINKLFP